MALSALEKSWKVSRKVQTDVAKARIRKTMAHKKSRSSRSILKQTKRNADAQVDKMPSKTNTSLSLLIIFKLS